MLNKDIADKTANWIFENREGADTIAEQRLIWADLETTGLDPMRDNVLEIGMMITDLDGCWVDFFNTVVHYTPEAVSDFKAESTLIVDEMHTKSGLWAEVLEPSTTNAYGSLRDFLEKHDVNNEPLVGSSVGFDKSFLETVLLSYPSYFSYRVIDISSLKELAKRLHPTWVNMGNPRWEQMKAHRSIPDIIDSIEEYRWYRSFLLTGGNIS